MSSTVAFSVAQFHLKDDLHWEGVIADDLIISEEPLEVWLKILPSELQSTGSAERLFTLMRTPGDDINLITGWLLSSGLISELSSLVSIHHTGQGRLKDGASNQLLVTLAAGSKVDLETQQRSETVNSACGICGQQTIEHLLNRLELYGYKEKTPVTPLSINVITGLAGKLFHHQRLFQQTGGVHAVALFDEDTNIVDVREDVGRHNALDKLIGANSAVLFNHNDQLDTQGMGLILSGRIGFEMIQKAAMANIHYILALGAPTSLAVELAQELDILLLGFIKPQRFNVYSNRQLLKP